MSRSFLATIAFLVCTPLCTMTLSAQDPGGAAARAAMDKLNWIEGNWRGPAWMQMGPRKSNADQTERIYRAAGGTVLIIHGTGILTDPGAPPNTVVHDAFGVMHFDATTKRYVLRSHVANGHMMETPVEVGDKTIVWGMDIPQMGRSRYTVSITAAGEWLEVGERSMDNGKTWTQFMEMKLTRMKASAP